MYNIYIIIYCFIKNILNIYLYNSFYICFKNYLILQGAYI